MKVIEDTLDHTAPVGQWPEECRGKYVALRLAEASSRLKSDVKMALRSLDELREAHAWEFVGAESFDELLERVSLEPEALRTYRRGLTTLRAGGELEPTGATPLDALRDIRRQIEQCDDFDELIDLRDKSAAAVTYAKAVGEHHEIVNAAVEAKLRCERKAGAFLKTVEKDAGGRPSENRSRSDTGLRLADIGVTKTQSHRWQKLADDVNDEQFDSYIEQCNDEGKELTTAGCMRHVAALNAVNNEPRNPDRENVRSLTAKLDKAIHAQFKKWDGIDPTVFAERLRLHAKSIDEFGDLRC